jgi:bacteriophage CI repressor helix-turn-helix domain
MLFVDFLERIKQELDLKKDKDVAQFLGIEPKAFSIRKKRDSIPVDAVRAAAYEHPEMNVDWSYILTGRRNEAVKKKASPSDGLSPEERELLAMFRAASGLGRAVILSAARGAEKKETASAADKVA